MATISTVEPTDGETITLQVGDEEFVLSGKDTSFDTDDPNVLAVVEKLADQFDVSEPEVAEATSDKPVLAEPAGPATSGGAPTSAVTTPAAAPSTGTVVGS